MFVNKQKNDNAGIYTIKTTTMDMICKGCMAKVPLIAAKKLGSRYYCPKCYEYIMTALKAGYKMSDED